MAFKFDQHAHSERVSLVYSRKSRKEKKGVDWVPKLEHKSQSRICRSLCKVKHCQYNEGEITLFSQNAKS